jgi:cytochrome c oxidase assembly protein subunit 15
VLGGVTVLFLLPSAVSTAHAALAEIFFCLTVAIGLFTSDGWIRGDGQVDDAWLRRVATGTTVLIFVQMLLGATMRHTGAGLAIPDFPLMFGGVVPDHWDSKIAIHFSHRVGALVVTLAIATSSGRVWRCHRGNSALVGPAGLLVLLVAIQVTLGALTVLSQRDIWINSVHVVCGALVLAASLVLTLRSWRAKFAASPMLEGAEVARPSGGGRAGAASAAPAAASPGAHA